MNLFQVAGFLALGLLVTAVLRSYLAGRIRFTPLLLWWALLMLGTLALVFPDATTIVARYIGIRRGADLLLYSAIFAGLFIAFLGYLRFRILDRQITQLVRQHALDNPAVPSKVTD